MCRAGRAPGKTSDVRLDLVPFPGGRYLIGSREGRPDEQPRPVVIGDLLIGRCEVTAAEFARFEPTSAPRWIDRKRPASRVSLADAQAYCAWLSEQTGERVRLPTDAEWECAARAGVRGRYPWGWPDADGRACFDARNPAKVGSFAPNAADLHDMAGNVAEWCVTTSGVAVVCGGSWAERDPEALCVYRRVPAPADYCDADVGFRIVVEHPQTVRASDADLP